MSTETLSKKQGGKRIVESFFDQLSGAMSGDLLPRNGSGVPTSEAGSLGSEVYRWLKARILSGHWSIGDIKPHHSYNGSAPMGQGWMLCDGRVINETNYNTEHGAGSWATYIGSSSLDGKYLPDLDAAYPIGAATTTQSGSSAITGVGSNTLDVSHTHQWHKKNGNSSSDQTYDSSGNLQTWTPQGASAFRGIGGPTSVGPGVFISLNNDAYLAAHSATKDIKPDSVKVQYYMRVV